MSDSPLHHRVLRSVGYLLTGLLVLGAVAVLAWPMMGKDDGGGGGEGARPRPTGQQPTPQGDGTDPFAMLDPNLDTSGSKNTGACGAKSASYKRAGDGIEITVVYTGVGTVRAVVLPAEGEPQIQSYTTAQDPHPHTFQFDGVSPQAIKKVSLTIMNSTGMTDCDVPRK
ncbi:hypothetical protein [Actinocorallia longicatena]|uniref:Secreted protein n=1 Tax=Actinocorallia longicatena TaxID=111803 RepID=A0ABP6Q9Q0_9ACTN